MIGGDRYFLNAMGHYRTNERDRPRRRGCETLYKVFALFVNQLHPCFLLGPETGQGGIERAARLANRKRESGPPGFREAGCLGTLGRRRRSLCNQHRPGQPVAMGFVWLRCWKTGRLSAEYYLGQGSDPPNLSKQFKVRA